MKAEDKKPANDWIKENYPDGVASFDTEGNIYIGWDLMLELMVLYAGHCVYESNH